MNVGGGGTRHKLLSRTRRGCPQLAASRRWPFSLTHVSYDRKHTALPPCGKYMGLNLRNTLWDVGAGKLFYAGLNVPKKLLFSHKYGKKAAMAGFAINKRLTLNCNCISTGESHNDLSKPVDRIAGGGIVCNLCINVDFIVRVG